MVNDGLQDLGKGWIRQRRRVILYSGPFYALFFLLFWCSLFQSPDVEAGEG